MQTKLGFLQHFWGAAAASQAGWNSLGGGWLGGTKWCQPAGRKEERKMT